MSNIEITVAAPDVEAVRELFGLQDETRRLIERELPVRVSLRDSELVVQGEEAEAKRAAALLEQLLQVARDGLRGGRRLQASDVRYLVNQAKSGHDTSQARAMLSQTVVTTERGKPIGPRTQGQSAYIEALRRSEMVFAIGPAGTGKCIASSSLVLTGEGMRAIGELGHAVEVDECAPLNVEVCGANGRELASGVYNGGGSPTLQLRTRFGFEIEATPEHPLLTLDERGELLWKRADALQPGDVAALSRGAQMFGTQTQVNFAAPRSPHDFSSRSVILRELDERFAYMMGVLTGDGCLTARNRVILSSADASIVGAFYDLAARFELHVFRNGAARPHDYIIASSGLRALLLHLGMSSGKAGTKSVPHAILRAPQPIVAAFLRGLFDADGTIEKRDGLVSFSTVSAPLAQQVQIVLLNFGVVSARSIKRGRYNGRAHLSQLLSIAGQEAARFHDLIGFGLERKRARRQNKTANVDLVPHLANTLKTAIASTTLSRAEHKRFDDYRRERRTPSYAKLGSLVGLLESRGAKAQTLAPLQEMLNRNLLFLPITSIEPSRAPVFDLTVPGTHSFVANGFVNHNTYLAVANAVAALKAKKVARIILTRPAVEAGERLGFLPGDLEAKIDPYLRPLHDALYDMFDPEKAKALFEKRAIEIAPLAYMRGRTINESYVILDEAQNTTPAQMKMFLTRLGFGSRMVITGDVTQTDLPKGQESGLRVADRVLGNVQGIEFVRLGKADVVRHNLVQRVIEAYEAVEGEF